MQKKTRLLRSTISIIALIAMIPFFQGCIPGISTSSSKNAPMSAASNPGDDASGSGGSSDSSSTPTPTTSEAKLGVTVSGLNRGEFIVFESAEGENLTIASNETSYFDYDSYQIGDAYSVSVETEPTGQNCSFISSESGVFATNTVAIVVVCEQKEYDIGGVVSSLSGTLVIANGEGGDSKTISSDGAYTFPTEVANQSAYDVSVTTQPTGQICTVSNGSGNVNAATITNINITCVDQSYTVGGTVSGLTSGSFTINNSDGQSSDEDLIISSNGTFTFTEEITHGDTYTVSVVAHPSGKTCSITNASAVMGGANITNIVITCATSYLVRGTVAGLLASNILIVENNDADPVSITTNGNYSFSVGVVNNATYQVTVATQPTGQDCVVANSNGTINGFSVSNANITCSNAEYTIGGTITGHLGSVVLQNNLDDDLTITSGTGTFTFVTPIAYLDTYDVTVLTPPTGQTCTVTDGDSDGTMGSDDITDISIECANATYFIGGTVSGAAGMTGSLILQNNVANDKTLTANGAYTFTSKIPYLGTYAVTVKTNPTNKTCTLSNASGTVSSAADVTNVDAACVTNYSVGGTLSGLATGGSFTVKNNGGNTTTLSSNAAYTFSTRLLDTAAYAVTVTTNPTGQTCTPSNDSGVIATADVSNADIACVDNTYSVGGVISGLSSGNLVLQLGGANDETFTASGAFSITTAQVNYGDAYAVTILTHPSGKTCTIANGTGTMSAANVTNIAIACATSTHTLGGTVGGTSGLTGTLVLQNSYSTATTSGTASATITASGVYTFTTQMDYGATYAVTATTTPSGQTCAVSNGTGTVTQVSGVNISNINAECYLDVDPFYSAASNWNDYIKASATSTSCDGTESDVEDCIHGGDKKVVTTVYASCTSLTLADDQGWFDWTCSVSAGKAIFTSALKTSKGLADFIDDSNPAIPIWKDNHVILTYSSTQVGISEDEAWWSNIVEALPADSGGVAQGLAVEGHIYVLGADYTSSNGYNIEADKVSLVVTAGNTLTLTIGGNTCKDATGEKAAADIRCGIASGGQKFLWIEGTYLGDGVERGLYFFQTNYSVLRNVIDSNFNLGIYLNDSDNNFFYNVNSSHQRTAVNSHGLSLYQSNNNLVVGLITANNTGDGVKLNDADSNRFYQLNTYNNDVNGLLLNAAASNIFVSLLASSNTAGGILIDTNSDLNHLLQMTITNNAAYGILISNTSIKNVIINATIVNNGTNGLSIESSSDYTLVGEIAARNNGTKDINLDTSSSNKFTGYLLVSDTSTFCAVSGGSSVGLNNATCAASDASVSAVSLSQLGSLASTFEGKLGTTAYGDSLWTTYTNIYQNWGENDAAAFPVVAHRVTCTGTCQHWDWSLASTDTRILKTSGNISTGNGTFTAGISCPSVAGGSNTIGYTLSAASISLSFMKTAVEKIDDNVGDNDGLCEANETCYYTPNFGAYQGSGTAATCSFSGSGSMTGVVMYGYPTNGE